MLTQLSTQNFQYRTRQPSAVLKISCSLLVKVNPDNSRQMSVFMFKYTDKTGPVYVYDVGNCSDLKLCKWHDALL